MFLARFISPRNYSLLREMVVADFKIRYQGSFFGYLWSLIRPLALFTVMYFVFTHIFRFGKSIEHYPVYLLLGIVLFNYFTEATMSGMRAIVDRGDLIRKVSMPKFIIVIAPAASAFINLLLNLIVVAIFAFFSHIDFSVSILIMPLLLVELLIASIATSFLLAALYVSYRDVAYIWELVIQVLSYAIPIIYPLQLVPERYVKILMANPLAQIVQDARWSLLRNDHDVLTGYAHMPHFLFLVPFAIIIVLIVLSTRYFRAKANQFAEDI